MVYDELAYRKEFREWERKHGNLLFVIGRRKYYKSKGMKVRKYETAP